jgi:endo-1,3(4)-beta-glucanase
MGPTATANVTSISADNIFQPIALDPPPPQITTRYDHPSPPNGTQPQSGKIETNKFYANAFAGDQTAGIWTHPYSLSWGNGTGESKSWGMAISHIERSQASFGAPNASIDAGQTNFIANPIGLQYVVLSAAELGTQTTLTTDSLTGFSVNVKLSTTNGSSPFIQFPLVQGMGFVTAIYSSGTPLVQSGMGITNLTYVGEFTSGTTQKYRATISGFTWLIYVSPSTSNYSINSFTLLNSGVVQGPSGFSGFIQVAKVPVNSTDAESVYDTSAGVYPTAANITGSVQGTTGTYSLSWSKGGNITNTLLMWALPHHVESFAHGTSSGQTDLQLVTTTKGYATLIRGDSWTLEEPNLPIEMAFAPWTPASGSLTNVSQATISLLQSVGASELSENITAQTDTGSLYYDGKGLAKFATICYTLNDIAGNATLAMTGLQLLENAFAFHVNNSMQYGIVYDAVYGGVVSNCSYEGGGNGCDFGNAYYNDHHFHYGYFVYAAAVIAYLDPDWLTKGVNKAWVNMLVRDYANSISDDPYFPFQRNFDWYHGHSWAHGIIETFDGKDQESSSEDTMSCYAIKMWGKIIGDTNMEARGNLQLAVQARSLQNYYLYTSDNSVEPPQLIGNKVAGILFENKIQHTTYFGSVVEYIQGIHMLPLLPSSTLTRLQTFVQQEWDAYFATSGIRPVDLVTGGWRGVVMGNYAIINPAASYQFFTTPNFDQSYLDSGASQTWYIAFSAALGGDGSWSSGSSKEKRETMAEKLSRSVSELRVRDGYIAEEVDVGGSLRSSRLRQRTSGLKWRL